MVHLIRPPFRCKTPSTAHVLEGGLRRVSYAEKRALKGVLLSKPYLNGIAINAILAITNMANFGNKSDFLISLIVATRCLKILNRLLNAILEFVCLSLSGSSRKIFLY